MRCHPIPGAVCTLVRYHGELLRRVRATAPIRWVADDAVNDPRVGVCPLLARVVAAVFLIVSWVTIAQAMPVAAPAGSLVGIEGITPSGQYFVIGSTRLPGGQPSQRSQPGLQILANGFAAFDAAGHRYFDQQRRHQQPPVVGERAELGRSSRTPALNCQCDGIVYDPGERPRHRCERDARVGRRLSR